MDPFAQSVMLLERHQVKSAETVAVLLRLLGRRNLWSRWRALTVTVLVATQGIRLQIAELFVQVSDRGPSNDLGIVSIMNVRHR